MKPKFSNKNKTNSKSNSNLRMRPNMMSGLNYKQTLDMPLPILSNQVSK